MRWRLFLWYSLVSWVAVILFYRFHETMITAHRADQLYAQGHYEEAVKLYEWVAETDPRYQSVNRHLMEYYLRMNRPLDAARCCELLYKNDSSELDALFSAGIFYETAGHLDNARRVYAELLLHGYADQFSLLARQARLLALAHEYNLAAVLYREALMRNPADQNVRLQWAELLGWMGQYEEASQEFQTVLKSAPSDASIRAKYALLLRQSGDFAAARSELEALLHQKPVEKPVDEPALIGLGPEPPRKQLQFELARLYAYDETTLSQAQELFTSLLKDEFSPETASELADVYVRIGHLAGEVFPDSPNYDKALALYHRILQVNPDDVFVQLRLANGLSRMGRYQEALNVFRDVRLLRPDDEQIRHQYAQALIWAGEQETALRELGFSTSPDAE